MEKNIYTRNLVITKKDRYFTLEEAQEIRTNIVNGKNEPYLHIQRILKNKYDLIINYREMESRKYKALKELLQDRYNAEIYLPSKKHKRRRYVQNNKIDIEQHENEINNLNKYKYEKYVNGNIILAN